MLAQINQLLEEKFQQEAFDAAVVVESHPPIFFIKAGCIIIGTVLITLVVRALIKKRRAKK